MYVPKKSLRALPFMSARSSLTSLRSVVGLTLVGWLGACDAQVGEEYPGEALATLHGTITVAEGTQIDGDAAATVVWHVWQDGDDASVTDELPVSGDFPASFTLSIYEPPPEAARFDVGDEDASLAGIHLATGYVTVLPAGYPGAPMQQLFEDALGVDSSHLLVWADGSIPESFLHGEFPGGLEPGYQLFRADDPDVEARACYAPFNACLDACVASHCDASGEVCDAGLDACVSTCVLPTDCPELVGQVQLVPVPLDSELAIVLGIESQPPNWF